MSTIPLRPLGFGEILDGAVQLYRRDFGLYYLIALLGALPGYILALLFEPDLSSLLGDGAPGFDAFFSEFRIVMAIGIVSGAIAWVGVLAVAAAMVERIGERLASVGRAYLDAIRYLPRAALAALTALFVFFVVGVVVFMVSTLVAAPLIATGNALVSLLAFAVFLLPIMALALAWLAATFGILPAVIIENRPAFDALRRSLSLCNGGWLRVIGIMCVAQIINLVPGFAVQALFGIDNLFLSPEELGTIDSGRQWLLNTINFVVSPLTTPFMVGSILMLFHDRRVRKEAFDLETAAGVMDSGTS
ncbi:MAG: hypothetical protein OXH51_09695 [Gemmatimonadetes bacterium]|nr:hypothetical protein [Gemmatimonadota bacterium]MCY3676922.1 hypothetical protein [Gemmatimonadota bacterium]MYA42428.1 hypothetical protein [Gemmatimonadota bacterium]MYE95492.1 hypothetical protein [Gemmatimonadota bacterium]MYJ10821.1 hypothetical protein [Gemmatimonadota bacterium]